MLPWGQRVETERTMPPNDARTIRPHARWRPLGVWNLLAGVAAANGSFREAVLIPRVGDDLGHVLSTALLAVAILISFV